MISANAFLLVGCGGRRIGRVVSILKEKEVTFKL
jgi:hypothetical protein